MTSSLVPKCSVLVLNWNGRSFLQECLDSLCRQDYKDFEIVLIDNGSTDDSVEYVQSAFPRVRIFRLKQNLGFCGANNLAIQDALSRGSTYVLLLNNDTVIAPNVVGEMMKVIESDPHIAVVCPKIYFARDRNVLWYAGADFSLWTARAKHRGYKRQDDGRFDGQVSITAATGCAMLIRCAAIAEVGMFNESLWAYAEDVEWCIRFRRAGYRLRFAPTAHVWHYDGGANVVAGSQAIRQYYTTRNLLYLGWKYARWWQMPSYAVGFTVTHVLFFILLRLWRSDYEALRALVRGIWDASRGSMYRLADENTLRHSVTTA